MIIAITMFRILILSFPLGVRVRQCVSSPPLQRESKNSGKTKDKISDASSATIKVQVSLIGALEDVLDKVLVVDIAVLVLEGGDEVFYVHLLHFFAQSRQQMSQFRRRYRTISVLVEHSIKRTK